MSGGWFEVPDASILGDALFENKKFADVIISASGREFKAHKAILATRSAVFDAMFENAMKESQDNLVEINDIEPEVVEEMLRYVYTGKVKNIANLAGDLISVADRYALDGLKGICAEELGRNITIETAAETLMLADLYRSAQLKSKAIDFFARNAAAVLETEGFKILENSQQRYLIDEAKAEAKAPICRRASGWAPLRFASTVNSESTTAGTKLPVRVPTASPTNSLSFAAPLLAGSSDSPGMNNILN